MNADGTGVVNHTNDAADDTDPDWSPDGTKIAFSSNRGGDSLSRAIYVVDVNDGQTSRLTTDTSVVDIQPAWSPDGGWLAMSRYSCPDTFSCSVDIWTIKADGTSLYWFAGTGGYEEYYQPVFSPDGRRIAYKATMPWTREGNIQVDRGDFYGYLLESQWIIAAGFDANWQR